MDYAPHLTLSYPHRVRPFFFFSFLMCKTGGALLSGIFCSGAAPMGPFIEKPLFPFFSVSSFSTPRPLMFAHSPYNGRPFLLCAHFYQHDTYSQHCPLPLSKVQAPRSHLLLQKLTTRPFSEVDFIHAIPSAATIFFFCNLVYN